MDAQGDLPGVLQRTGGLPPSAFLSSQIEPLTDIGIPPESFWINSLEENYIQGLPDTPAFDSSLPDPSTFDWSSYDFYASDGTSLSPLDSFQVNNGSQFGQTPTVQMSMAIETSREGQPPMPFDCSETTQDISLTTSELLGVQDADQGEQQSSFKKGKRLRISEKVKTVLDEHFQSQPYPDNDNVSALANMTNMTIQQVKNWFTNTRTRRMKKSTVPQSVVKLLQMLTEFSRRTTAHSFRR
jgi:hypothetical protein